jgi:protein involved in polysaccharide export with SLBB domain
VAFSNPVGQGIPVSRLPPEFLAEPKQGYAYIPLTALRQPTPDAYLVDKGDVLGIYIEGVLGDKTQPPPVRFAELPNVPPSIGFPIPVREDGTLPLPLIEPVNVRGMTVAEIEAAIRKAFIPKLVNPDKHIFVSLVRPRTYHIQVVRQDAGGGTSVPINTGGLLYGQRRNSGAAIDLPAYENDVLNALNRSGGLPGLEAAEEVVVQHEITGQGTKVTRIPLKMRPGEPVPFSTQDIVLNNGDVVFVEARNTEVFYTGGLLLPRQFIIPRDYDLRVVEAVALAGGPMINGLFSQNNLTGQVGNTGLSSPSPSHVTVLRRTKHEGLIPIIVNLNVAYNDLRENIIVQSGDVIILQETLGESMTRYVTGIVRFNYLEFFFNNSHTISSGSVSAP